MSSSKSTPRRWTLVGRMRPKGVRIPLVDAGPPLGCYEQVDVMPVSEHLKLWNAAHAIMTNLEISAEWWRGHPTLARELENLREALKGEHR